MEKLVKKAKKGDAEAFIALMEQNRQIMIRIAFAYLGNEEDVADAMQETILSAFEKLDTLRRAEYFRTWLIRILINQCIAMRRHSVTDLMNCHGFAYMNCHQIDWFSVISQPHRAAA